MISSYYTVYLISSFKCCVVSESPRWVWFKYDTAFFHCGKRRKKHRKHKTIMTSHPIILNNIFLDRYGVLQINKTKGNICLSCKNGRTRSPMYLVAYLVLCYEMSVEEAYATVGSMLLLNRNQIIDRKQKFYYLLL